MSKTSTAPVRCSAASGMICSTYSGSAPSVKPCCHQAACSSHSVKGSTRRTVELGVQGMGDLLGQPREALEVLEAGLLHGRDPTQLLQQPLLAARAETGDIVDGALRHALAAQLSVI